MGNWKRLIAYAAVSVLLFVITYFTHKYLLASTATHISVLGVYLFFMVASIVVYVISSAVFEFMPNSTGYVFLAAVFIKMGFFVLIFKDNLFAVEKLQAVDKIVVITPFFIYLIQEVVGLANLLKLFQKPTAQKV